MPDTMRQWWTVPGPEGGFSELRRVPVPEPGEGEVLVRVAGAGVNRGELIARPGLHSSNPNARAAPSGNEFAGRVAAVGKGVSGWQEGDRVVVRGNERLQWIAIDEIGDVAISGATTKMIRLVGRHRA